jgi:hypothetical protein
MRAVLLAAIVFLYAAGSAFGQQRAITVAQAESLVRVVLKHQRLEMPSRYCEMHEMTKDLKAFIADYYSFAPACDYPNSAATTPLGLFVVSPRTGEVWEFNNCEVFTFPKLLRLRRKLVPQNDATEKAEAKYRISLGCRVEPPTLTVY